jgi:hypothetical protein
MRAMPHSVATANSIPSAAGGGCLDELPRPFLIAFVVDDSQGEPAAGEVTQGLVVAGIAAGVAIGGHVHEIGAVAGGVGQLNAQREIPRQREVAVLVVPVAEVQPTFDIARRSGQGSLGTSTTKRLSPSSPAKAKAPLSAPISTATS